MRPKKGLKIMCKSCRRYFYKGSEDFENIKNSGFCEKCLKKQGMVTK